MGVGRPAHVKARVTVGGVIYQGEGPSYRKALAALKSILALASTRRTPS